MKLLSNISLVLVALLMFTFSAFAADDVSAQNLSKLALAKHDIGVINSLPLSDDVKAQKIQERIDQVSKDIGLTVSQVMLDNAPQVQDLLKPGVWQQIKGWFSFITIMLILSAIVGIVCLAILVPDIFSALLSIFTTIPVQFWESLWVVLSLAAGVYGLTWPPDSGQYWGLVSLLSGAGAFIYLYNKYEWAKNIPLLDNEFVITLGFAVISAAYAYAYSSWVLGFATAIGITAALGFSFIATGLSYGFGFKNDDAMGRSLAGSILVLIAGIILRVKGVNNPVIDIFSPGIFWVGTFVSGLTLLITSSVFYRYEGHEWKVRNSYGARQILPALFFISTIYFGNVYGLGSMGKISLIFLVFFIIDKYVDITSKLVEGYKSVTFATLVLAAVIFWVSFYLYSHPQVIQQYWF